MTLTRQAPILVIPARDIGQKEAKTMDEQTTITLNKTQAMTLMAALGDYSIAVRDAKELVPSVKAITLGTIQSIEQQVRGE